MGSSIQQDVAEATPKPASHAVEPKQLVVEKPGPSASGKSRAEDHFEGYRYIKYGCSLI